jgi:hypothetical protein
LEVKTLDKVCARQVAARNLILQLPERGVIDLLFLERFF